MARIDFAFGASERISQACQTSLKQYLAGQKLVVYASEIARLKEYDQKLWGVEDAAFVPHVWADDPLAPQTPILLVSEGLAQALEGRPPETWLLNLDDACPPTLGTLQRVLEIVSDDPDDKDAARHRWRMYQAAGHDVKSYSLQTPLKQPD
jgi:DNA polymerase III subunit chi